MSTEINNSPAGKVMDEAIDLAIEGRSPYPEKSAFIDADTPRRATRFSAPPMKVARSFSFPPMAVPVFLRPELTAH